MANPIAINGTHKRRETYADEVLAMAKSKINIYEDFSTDYEIDGANLEQSKFQLEVQQLQLVTMTF